MVSEKSYDALPNFTAADCKGFGEREGWRKRRKEGGEEGGRGEGRSGERKEGRRGGGREGGGTGYTAELQLCFQVCG